MGVQVQPQVPFPRKGEHDLIKFVKISKMLLETTSSSCGGLRPLGMYLFWPLGQNKHTSRMYAVCIFLFMYINICTFIYFNTLVYIFFLMILRVFFIHVYVLLCIGMDFLVLLGILYTFRYFYVLFGTCMIWN